MRTAKWKAAYGQDKQSKEVEIVKGRKSFPLKLSPLFSSPNLASSHRPSFKNNLETHVFMVHTLHEDQLPVSSLGMRLVLKGSAELLNGHVSVKDSIIGSTAEIQEQSRNKNKGYFLAPAYLCAGVKKIQSWILLRYHLFEPFANQVVSQEVTGTKKKLFLTWERKRKRGKRGEGVPCQEHSIEVLPWVKG